MRYFLRFFLKVLLVLSLGCCLLYALVIAYLLHYEKDLIFVGQDNRAVQSVVHPNFKSEIINTLYGKTEIYTNDVDSKNVVFYFPGNNENANYYLKNLSNLFKDTKIVSINYPNYGNSSYPLTQQNIDLTSLEITNKFSKDKKAIIIGRSIGTGFASFVAANINNLDKLILITPYSRIQNLAGDIFPFIPDFIFQSLMELKMDNINNIYQIKNQKDVLIIYSPFDELITYKNIQSIERHFPNINYLKYPSATHDDIHKYFELDDIFLNFIKN